MADPLALRSREEIAGDIVRDILNNSDLNDVAPNSTLANLIEGIASVEFQTQMSVLKILEASNIESLTGTTLDKKAISLGLPNTIGGKGRIPANQASGPVTIGSNFQKISSKPYAGKPAPFAGSTTLYLENASSFPATGSVYLGRGTVDRFEGPIPYSSVTNNGSFWSVQLSVPLTKSHPYTDLVVVSQGGDRNVNAGTQVQVPPNSTSPAVTYKTNVSIVIPDGESSASVQVTCVSFGTVGNALIGAISQFQGVPFPGATVTNPTSFVNGQPVEQDEALRLRIKNFPSTLSRGTATAILAALQGARDPLTGHAIVSSTIIEPAAPGESAKVYIDDGTGLEPTFVGQPYELLLNSASGQETKFSTAQRPVTMAIAIGTNVGPFVLTAGDQLTITVDGVSETYTIQAANYQNLNSVSAYEVVRDFNSQANLIGWRTIGGGAGVAGFDLSGQSEIMTVTPGTLQTLFGLPVTQIRPIFLYKDSKLLSFRGHTATLTTSAFPWVLTSADLTNNIVVVDGVPETFSIADSDFATFTTNIATATLAQWAEVFAKKIAGVQFTVLGNTLIWQTYQAFSPTGSLSIPLTRADGSLATWIGTSKIWSSTETLSDVGANKDFNINRFLGQIELIDKPAVGAKIEIGSRTTRGQIDSVVSANGLFVLQQVLPGIGNSKLILGFDGEFAPRAATFSPTLTLTPTFPDATNAYNIIRLTSNDTGVYAGIEVGDWTYIAQDTSMVPAWGTAIEGFYLVKAAGVNGYALAQTYNSLAANVAVYTALPAGTHTGSKTVTVTKTAHGLSSGTLITVSTSTAIGGLTSGNLSQISVPIVVLDVNRFTYQAPVAATSDASGTLDDVGTNVVTVTQVGHGFKSGAAISVTTSTAIGNISAPNLSVTTAGINVVNSSTYQFYALAAAINPGPYSGTLDTVVYNADSWIEFEVSTPQRAQWSALIGTPQPFGLGMFSAFGSSVTPQLVNFGLLGTSTADTVVSTINSQISGGTAVKVDPQTVAIRSNDYLTTGTVAVLAVIGNAKNVFPVPQVDTSFQAHVGSSSSGDIGAGAPVITNVVSQTANSAGYGTQAYLVVDRQLTEVLDTNANPSIQSASTESVYPLGFQHLWLTGRNIGLNARVYNTTPTPQFAGQMRGYPNLAPAETSDSRQVAAVGVYDRYAQYGIRLRDVPLTENDRLVVVMDNNPTDETVAVPFFKTAQILDMDALTGSGPGTVISFRLSDPDDLVASVPRPFFDSTSVYANFDFNDFKLLTQSVGVYKDSTGATMPARGSITLVGAGAGLIQPGDTFTLNDGVNPATTFEFTNTTPGAGHVAITYTLGAAATGSLTAIGQGPGLIQPGDNFTIGDGTNVPTVFEFNSGTPTAGRVKVAYTAAAQATGTLTATFADPTTGIKSGDLFTLSDGVTSKTFEFTTTTPAAGHVAVTITATMTDTNVKAAMLAAINSAGLTLAAFSGTGDLINLMNTSYGTAGNVAITQTMQNAGVTLQPTGMSGGINYPTAAAIKTAMLAAIASVSATLFVTATSGAGNLINLANNSHGSAGNIAITQSISNSQTLTPVGMSGGANDPSAFVLKGLTLAAINGASGLLITADAGAGNTLNLVNSQAGTQGNQAITQSLSNGQTLNPTGMSGASSQSGVGDIALVLRSVSFGAVNKLQLSIRYQTVPNIATVQVTHLNQYNTESDEELIVILPSGSLVAGSLYAVGSYTVEAIQNLNLVRLRFTAAGLNTGSQYQVGNVINVGGNTPLAGSYKITYTAPGVVEALAPGIVGFATQSFDSSLYPLQSFPIAASSFVDVANAINAYNPTNPIATAQAIGVNASTYMVTNPTYITYTASTPYSGTDMAGAFDHHVFNTKYAGSAGIYSYDSSNPSLNNIKALVQAVDSIFPNQADAAGTTYTPVGEQCRLVPTNAVTIARWMNFNAVSSLPILAAIETKASNNELQISSLQDGSEGAVKISGVSANSVSSFVISNATNSGTSTKARILWSDAKGLSSGQLVSMVNSVNAEIQRPYRETPVLAEITPANTIDPTIFFRSATAVRYIQLSATTARLQFLRSGMGPSQTESLQAGNTIQLTNLGNGLVKLTSAVGSASSGGVLSARVGDMAYIKPVGSPFAVDAQCKALPDAGISSVPTGSNLAEYWGYPVVYVQDDFNIIVIAPNITTFSTVTLATSYDLVFIPAIWNEKNIQTNYAAGAKFETAINAGQCHAVVKTLGAGLVSIFLQNSATEVTDTMLLNELSVSTDDFVVIGTGFNISNQGTFRLVAHNGRNHIILFNPNGGVDELIDTTTFQNGGIGSRKWGVGPMDAPRPIRILDSESVQVGQRLRISAALNNNQWFPASMIGTFQITNIGYCGLDYTGTSLPHTASQGTPNPNFFCPYIDFVLPSAPIAILDQTNAMVDTFILGSNASSLGFVESTPATVYRMVQGFGVNPQNPEEAEVFLQPQLNTGKFTNTYGTQLNALNKAAFPTTTFTGIDGYKIFSGLIQQAHQIIDGNPTNLTLYPGVRAAGTSIEVLPPTIKTIQVNLTVRPKDGVSLNSISEVVTSALAGYVNNLGVGQPVVISEMIRVVQSLPGVFSTTIVSTFPVAQDDRIVVGDIEKCLILNANTDITVG